VSNRNQGGKEKNDRGNTRHYVLYLKARFHKHGRGKELGTSDPCENQLRVAFKSQISGGPEYFSEGQRTLLPQLEKGGWLQTDVCERRYTEGGGGELLFFFGVGKVATARSLVKSQRGKK